MKYIKEKYLDNQFIFHMNQLYENRILFKSLNDIGAEYDKWIDHYNTYTPLIQWQNRLLEFIQTVNPEWVHNKLTNIEGYIDMFYVQPLWYVRFYDDKVVDRNKIKFNENVEIEISKIIEACGFTESYREFSQENKHIVEIALMPNYTQDVTDYVYNVDGNYKHAAILYHVCPKDIWKNKISKTGIIPKAGNKHKRYYLPKAYFYTQLLNFDLYAENLNKGIVDIKYKEYVNCKEYVVLKIDLNKRLQQYKFYNDDEYPLDKVVVFTYDTIHPKCIELYQEIKL